jgi:hypothetical protein
MGVVSLSNATVPSYRRIVVAVYGKLKMGQSVDFMQKYISNLIATYRKQLGSHRIVGGHKSPKRGNYH